MKAWVPAAAGLLLAAASPASAANLCNCCGTTTAAACTKACEPIKVAVGQCIATVDFEATAAISAGVNPLYDVPLKNVWLGKPSRQQLEAFRLLLEAARKAAEGDRKDALKAHARKQIDDAAAAAAARRYDDAIVNYFLGAHAYTEAAAAK